MSRKIYKYTIAGNRVNKIEMPEGAEILTVQMQHEEPQCARKQDNSFRPQVWALVDPSKPRIPRKILMVGTGHPVKESNIKYISTIQVHNGALIFHFFELLGDAP
ncbi:MAG: hypothetical protein M0R74_09725 [Dehalococcoidia bacterium]|nr:hypothetical protein [Dehalococcoidia bacterium]